MGAVLNRYVQNKQDLQTFLAYERPEAVGTYFTQYLVNGGTNNQTNDALSSSGTTEAALDIQFGVGIAYPTPVSFYSTGGRPPSTLEPNDSEPYLDWIQFVLAQDQKDIPQTSKDSLVSFYSCRCC